MGCVACHATESEVRVPTGRRDADYETEDATEFHKQYALGERLGAGAYGCVYSARRVLGGDSVAVKVVDARAADADGMRNGAFDRRRQRAVSAEVVVLKALPASPHVVALRSIFAGAGLVYMVLERCDMGLLEALRSTPELTEAALQPVFKDMLSALVACHAAGVVHRDVKCDNFLVALPEGGGRAVKLCDFGLATRLKRRDSEKLSGICGTPPYMSPEMLEGRPYGTKVDVWSLGVTAYVLLYGRWPYEPAVRSNLMMKDAIRVGWPAPEFRVDGHPESSAACGAWARSLLRRDPQQRPSAEEALLSESFRTAWASDLPLDATLEAAVNCGAFAMQSQGRSWQSGVHALVAELNADCRTLDKMPLSETSTCASSGTAALRR